MDADIASAGAGPHSRDFDLLLQYCAASSAPIARDMESFHRQGAFIFAGETVPKVGYLAFLNYLERYYPAEYRTMFLVPFHELPLEMTGDRTGFLALWRIAIGK